MESSNEKNLQTAKRRVLLAVSDRFADFEYETIRTVLESEGIYVRVASHISTPLTGMGGLRITPDVTFDNVLMDDFSALLLIGGEGTIKYFWSNEPLRSLIIKAHQKGMVIGAICASTPTLARAGVIRNVPATVYPFPEAVLEIKSNGGIYQNEPVVVSGRIVTGRDPASSESFAYAACRLIHTEK